MDTGSALLVVASTTDLWWPSLKWMAGQISATSTGEQIDESFRRYFSWLKDPKAENAFKESFEDGLLQFHTQYGDSVEAQTVGDVLLYIATHKTLVIDRGTILHQIFASEVDLNTLSGIISRYSFAIENVEIDRDKVAAILVILIDKYLRPAFRANPYFTEQVGFAQVIGLLERLVAATTQSGVDIDQLKNDYYARTAEKFEYIAMQGISPRVQNKTIGIRMSDVFIPLRCTSDEWFNQMALEAYTTGRNITIGKLITDLDKAITLETGRYQTLNKKAVEGMRKIEELRELFDSFARDIEEQVIEITSLMKHQNLVVQGDPGTGKSTLTRYIAWAIATGQISMIGDEAAGKIPIRLRAIEFGAALDGNKITNLEEYIISSEHRFGPLMKYALVSGSAIIMIDGLDEVSTPMLRAKVRECVDNFVADPAFSDCQMIITTRIVGYERAGVVGRFPHFTLVELSDEQISKFVQSWYSAIQNEMPLAINVESERDQLMQAILNSDGIHRMARNPLLLTIIALIKWQGRALPDQRVLLYDVATQTLIRSWPLTQRNVDLDELLIREWLAPVAFRILTNGTSDLIDQYSLMDELVSSMRHLQSMTEFEAKQASEDLLRNVSEHSGILLPRGTDSDGQELYGFLHRTFAEYLAAYYLVGLWADDELNLLDYAHDLYWREVLLLMAGHRGAGRRTDGGKFIKAIHNLKSSEFEAFIHRDLLLANRILGDGVLAAPSDYIDSLLNELLVLWRTTLITPLRADIDSIITDIGHTGYGSVIARLAMEGDLAADEILYLAHLLGNVYFRSQLFEILDGTDARMHARAALALASDDHDDRIENILFEISEDPSSEFQIRAIIALAKLKSHRTEVLFTQLLHDPKETARQQASAILVFYPEIIKTFENSLDDLDPGIFLYLAGQIPMIHQLSDAMLGKLEILMRQGDNSTKLRAASIFRYHSEEQSAAIFEELLTDTNPEIQLEASEILISNKNSKAIQSLTQLISQTDEHIKLKAASLLIEHSKAVAIKSLKDLLGSSDITTQLAAARTLLKSRNEPKVIRMLWKLLEDQSDKIRFEAFSILREHPDQTSIRHLEKLLDGPKAEFALFAGILLYRRSDKAAYGILQTRLSSLMNSNEQPFGSVHLELGICSLQDLAYKFILRHLTASGRLEFSQKKSSNSKR